jgi:hypothetical protein
MASNVDTIQLLTWFANSMRALSLTQSVGTTTTVDQLVTSQASQNSADTGLTVQEKVMTTLLSSAINATTPSSNMHAHFGTLLGQ